MTSPQEIIARAMVPILSGGQEDDLGRDLPDKQFDDLTPEWQGRFCEYAAAVEASLTHSGMAIVPVEIVSLLVRYRQETPLGHQPHMIAGEVDRLITALQPKGAT